MTHSGKPKLGCPIQFVIIPCMTERRLTRRGRETRERIVAAAAELIFERGVAETTLEDIRAAAG